MSKLRQAAFLLFTLVVALPAWAAPVTIMFVDFELRDVSPLPNSPQEIERTALLSSIVRQSLTDHGYRVIDADQSLRRYDQEAEGYLYDRPEVAARLAEPSGADYVLMGQVWKPSYLFVFPQVQMVDTRKNLTRAQLVVLSRYIQLEASTLDRNVTENAAKRLADQILAKLKELRPAP